MFETRVDFGLGSFFVAESSGNSGWIACEEVRTACSFLTGSSSDHLAVDKELSCIRAITCYTSSTSKPYSFYFVSALAQSERSKTWSEFKTGMEEWLSSWLRLGDTFKVIERERRTFSLDFAPYTFTPCTSFNVAMTYNTKLMGSTVFASLATLFLSRSWCYATQRSVSQYVEVLLFFLSPMISDEVLNAAKQFCVCLWFCTNMHGQIPCVHEPRPIHFFT